MAFKVSNETKVGTLTAVGITLLILGFSFLKGNNPMKKSSYLYARFPAIEGLVSANPVICNGLVIGTVYKTEPSDEYLTSVLVTIRITENIKLPDDSWATIKGNLLSTPAVEIAKGKSNVFLQRGDTILTEVSSGFLGAVLDQLGPTQAKLNNALGGLDTLLQGANRVLDIQTQANLRKTLANLSQITANLSETTKALNTLLQQQNNTIAKTLANFETSSNNLAEGTKQLPVITKNLETVTKNLSELELDQLVKKLDASVGSLKQLLEKMNTSENTMGALMNDRKLYDNLTSTLNSMNLLMQDLRLHPKRYVNVSVFGKKDKSDPLMRPMEEDSITQEQFKKQ